MRDLVLDPAGMTRSGFQQPPDAELDRFADGHTGGAPLSGQWHIYPELAAAGLWTTPSDLARFVIAIQEAKKGSSKPILSSRLIGEMLRNQIGDFGLGVFLGGHGRSAVFFHNGSNAGFDCFMVGFTETGQGAVIMANANDSFGVIQDLTANLSAEYGWPG
jgi:CubicO group peptidase (beta-lactamase class C family)